MARRVAPTSGCSAATPSAPSDGSPPGGRGKARGAPTAAASSVEVAGRQEFTRRPQEQEKEFTMTAASLAKAARGYWVLHPLVVLPTPSDGSLPGGRGIA